MYSNDVIKFMDDINTVMSFIEGALKSTDIINYRLTDKGSSIDFSVLRKSHDVLLSRIAKTSEDSLRDIFEAIEAKYQTIMEIGATCFNVGKKEITWNLAPVLGNNTLIEFISPKDKDQQWFYEKIENGTKQKGLR